jgi:hypothetical protein
MPLRASDVDSGFVCRSKNAFVAGGAKGARDEFTLCPANVCAGCAKIRRTKAYSSQLAFMRRIWGVTGCCDVSVRAGCPPSWVVEITKSRTRLPECLQRFVLVLANGWLVPAFQARASEVMNPSP